MTAPTQEDASMSTIARHARFRSVDSPPEPMGRANMILIPKDDAVVTLDPRAARRTPAKPKRAVA